MNLDQLITGNDQVQLFVASERAAKSKKAIVLIAPQARHCLEQEVFPQLEESVTSREILSEVVDSTKESIEQAFQTKSELYVRLTRYKGIEQSDSQFLADVLNALDEWNRKKTRELQEEPTVKEVTIKLPDVPKEDIVVSSEAPSLEGLRF